jgi:hypothetical protein
MKQVQVIVKMIVKAMVLMFGCVLIQSGLVQSALAQAQQVVATNMNVAVPPLVNFSGLLTDSNGRPISGTTAGTVAVTFSLYAEQSGGAALWMETQNVQPDVRGHYTVMLGSTSSTGLPSDIFVAGQAHWLGVQVEGESEQARVLLVSAPYALKAGDAQTLGGLPASAFVLAAPSNGAAPNAASPELTSAAATPSLSLATTSATTSATSLDVTTSGGTVNAIPLFSTATNIQNSLLTQTATSAINVGGKLNLAAAGTATASAGSASRPLDLVASVYDSSTSAAVPETFQWQAQAVDNDTATPTATLNLLFGSSTNSPTQTGLHIASTGLISFASGQTFAGAGTITGVTTASGSGLSGGGTTGALTLSLATNCASSQVLQWSGTKWACSSAGTGTITGVTAGTGLTGGGSSGKVTLSLNTSTLNSTYAQLGVANTFTANQAITGNLTASGTVTAAGATINSSGLFPLEVTGSNSGSTTIYGHAANTTGPAWGVDGQTDSTNANAYGVYGLLNSTSGHGAGVFGQSNSLAGAGVAGAGPSQGGAGVEGTTTNGVAIFGADSGANGASTGVWGVSTSTIGVGVVGQANAGTGSSNYGVLGQSDNVAVYGQAAGGSSTGAANGFDAGVWGDASNGSFTGVLGTADNYYAGSFINNSSLFYPALYALANSATVDAAIAVMGEGVCCSGVSADFSGDAGVWGDSGGAAGGSAGIVGTADDNSAGDFLNNSHSSSTIYLENSAGGSTGAVIATHTASGDCLIGAAGDVACSGKVTSVVETEGGAHKVSLYAMQSPENWFEDAGSAQLSNGSVRVEVEPAFAQTVNTGVDYHVFLTPNGDCKGLYVSQKTATSFEVHELGGGRSSIAFDYRIMAKRSGSENIRMQDVTDRFNAIHAQAERVHRPHADRKLAQGKARPRAIPGSAPVLPKLPPMPRPLVSAARPQVAQASR